MKCLEQEDNIDIDIYRWWSNCISFNMGYDEECRDMHDLMRGYAFSVKKYQFVSVLYEFQGTQ